MKLQTLLAGAAMAITAALAGSANAQITNGGFETGDFTGWTVNATFTDVRTAGSNSENPHSGTYFARLGDASTSYPYGTITQTVADTASQNYILSYWLLSDGRTPNFFSADWNGVELSGSAVSNNHSDGRPDGYIQYQFNVTGTGSDVLTFHEQNVPAYLALDDVSLSAVSSGGAVPEPATWAMMLTGFVGAGAMLRNRRRVALAA